MVKLNLTVWQIIMCHLSKTRRPFGRIPLRMIPGLGHYGHYNLPRDANRLDDAIRKLKDNI